jgi:polysaccharide export outer membrane protein
MNYHRFISQRSVKFCIAGGLICFSAAAQTPQPPSASAPQPALNSASAAGFSSVRPDYTLGPNDQILVRAPQADEINERPFRVDADGFINLPIVGRVRAGGLTVQALEAEIAGRLREYIRDPQIVITMTQFRSDPVIVNGAFRVPGLYPLSGRRTLIELLTAVGGLMPNASRRIKVTRHTEYGTIPLPNAVESADKKTSTVEISLQSLTEQINPAEDIVLQAFDVVTADRAEKVYVNGEVLRVGGIELGERDAISIVQALTEAGGFTQFAIRDKVRVLRPVRGTNRRAEMLIDM